MVNADIELQLGVHGCTSCDACFALRDRFMKRMVGQYVSIPNRGVCAKLVSAVIDLSCYDGESYFSAARKVHKGAAIRQAKKSDREGYICHQFVWRNYIPDVVEINNSMEVRSGGVMRDAYRRDVDELGGPPVKLHSLKAPACPVHHTYCWGIFKPEEGYKQGEVVTNEKLLGYIKFKRNGNFGLYTSILGHGGYLRDGIMHRLHHDIVRWIYSEREGVMMGLDYIVYGAIDSGNEGLKQWKRRALFESRMLALNGD
jgi:hypothetical protein